MRDSLLRSKSFTLRAEYDKDAWKIFSTAPLLGRGLGSTENVTRSVQSFQYESRYAHNHLLQTMADTGLVGTVFVLAFVLGSAWLCLRAVRKEKDSLAAALLAVCTMAAYRSRAQLSAGAAPRLTLYMQPGEEPLAAAGALVEALRLHETDTQQMNGAQPPEEAKHEE